MVKSPTKNGIKKLFALAGTDNIAPCTTVHNDVDEIIVAVYPTLNQEDTSKTSKKATASSPVAAALNGTGDDSIKRCVVSDGRDYLPAFAMGESFRTKSKGHQSLGSKPCLIRLKSYISSSANAKDLLLVLVSGDIVQRHYQNKENKPPSPTSSFFRPFSLQHGSKDQEKSNERNNHRSAKNAKKDASLIKIPGGGAPRFFHQWAPAISNHALAGIPCKLVSNKISARMTNAQHNATVLCNFLNHHNAMSTLHHQHNSSHQMMDQSSSLNATSNNMNASSQQQSTRAGGVDVQYYMSALNEFHDSQIGRQKASLTSNSGREDANRAKMIETQYFKALTAALGGNGAKGTQQQAALHLSRNTICFWHSILCGDGVHEGAGRLRSKAVRVGHVYFRPHAKVPGDVDTLCEAFRALENRLLRYSHSLRYSQAEGNLQGWEAATFAAAVFFGLVDTHAFADGNGRLARIAVNWALQKAGLPFVVHLFATPSQRKEYTEAIVQTRRNLSLVSTSLSGSSETSDEHTDLLAHALEYAGALFPLVDLILDRVAKAISEFERVIHDKSRLVSEETEAKAAKAARDRERAGTCLICFEDNPNIATLCCGKAVHLNCVAQWISNCSVDQATCPNCRESFPSLPPRLQAPTRSENNGFERYQEEDESSTVSSSMEDSTEVSDESSTSTTSSEIMHALAEAARNSRLAGEDYDEDDEEEEDSSDDSVPANDAAGDLARYLMYEMAAQNEGDESSADSTSETMEVDIPAARTQDDEHFEISSTTEEDEDETTQEMQEDSDEGSVSSTDEGTTQTSHQDSSAPDGLPPFCWGHNCRNRSARDCANASCGRCCILHGEWECERHRGDL